MRFFQFLMLFEKSIVGVCNFLFTETDVFITLLLTLSKNFRVEFGHDLFVVPLTGNM